MSGFAIGDVVRLKSGGPAMTIESFRRGVDDRKEAHCVWLQADGAHHGVFPLEILEHVGEPARSGTLPQVIVRNQVTPPVDVLAVLRSPEGRAAIADVMRRPPVRMLDGTWREPRPGCEARPGDLVRYIDGAQCGEVFDVTPSGDLWIRDELLRFMVKPTEVEVVTPDELRSAIRAPIARRSDGDE